MNGTQRCDKTTTFTFRSSFTRAGMSSPGFYSQTERCKYMATYTYHNETGEEAHRCDKHRLAPDSGWTEAAVTRLNSAGSVLVEGGEFVRVTFAEKPERSVLDALKSAGFRWNGGSWHGRRDKLPATVVAERRVS